VQTSFATARWRGRKSARSKMSSRRAPEYEGTAGGVKLPELVRRTICLTRPAATFAGSLPLSNALTSRGHKAPRFRQIIPIPAFLAFLADDTKVCERTCQYVVHLLRFAAWPEQRYQAALFEANHTRPAPVQDGARRAPEAVLGQCGPGRPAPLFQLGIRHAAHQPRPQAPYRRRRSGARTGRLGNRGDGGERIVNGTRTACLGAAALVHMSRDIVTRALSTRTRSSPIGP
jgi:hypothetical protein